MRTFYLCLIGFNLFNFSSQNSTIKWFSILLPNNRHTDFDHLSSLSSPQVSIIFTSQSTDIFWPFIIIITTPSDPFLPPFPPGVLVPPTERGPRVSPRPVWRPQPQQGPQRPALPPLAHQRALLPNGLGEYRGHCVPQKTFKHQFDAIIFGIL